jgi:hypothetical protein
VHSLPHVVRRHLFHPETWQADPQSMVTAQHVGGFSCGPPAVGLCAPCVPGCPRWSLRGQPPVTRAATPVAPAVLSPLSWGRRTAFARLKRQCRCTRVVIVNASKRQGPRRCQGQNRWSEQIWHSRPSHDNFSSGKLNQCQNPPGTQCRRREGATHEEFMCANAFICRNMIVRC